MITAVDISLPMVRDVPAMPLLDLMGFLGTYSLMEPLTEELLAEQNERAWRGPDIARGHYWHTSFHASENPGDDSLACERYLVYRMMNVPPSEYMPPWVTVTGDVGKAGELTIARAWFEGGRALAVPDDYGDKDQYHQIVFENPDLWVSGSTDLPILPPGSRKVHIVEIKGKADEVLEAMINGDVDRKTGALKIRRWDPPHRRQLLTSLGLAHEYDWGQATVCRRSWRILDSTTLQRQGYVSPHITRVDLADDFAGWDISYTCPEHGAECPLTFDLEPPDTGEIYYWSRSWPRKTMQFFFTHDPEFMQKGYEVIARARESFRDGILPPKREGFTWSMGACAKCPMKKFACKPDWGSKKADVPVAQISESHGLQHAANVRGEHDHAEVVRRVEERWA